MSEREKEVDESWKNRAAQEKDILGAKYPGSDEDAKTKLHVSDFEKKADSEPSAETSSEPSEQQSADEPAAGTETGSENPPNDIEITFLNYISSLGFQAMVFLGEIPSPVTEKIEKNLDQAKFLIDTLIMIREKTKGNLNKQEEDLLNASVYQLELKFIEEKQKEASGTGASS